MTQPTIERLGALPSLTCKERDAAYAVQRHLEEMPIGAKTPGIKSPTFEAVAMTLPDGSQVYRQPFPRLRETVWLFDSKEARDAFLDLYIGEPLES